MKKGKGMSGQTLVSSLHSSTIDKMRSTETKLKQKLFEGFEGENSVHFLIN